MTMSILINMPEYLQHAEVGEAHQLLLEWLHLLHTLNLSFKDSNDCMFHIVADLRQAIVFGIGEVSLC